MTVLDDLRQALLEARNTDGGWGYYRGKASRLEPTCWALLALGVDAAPPGAEFLSRCQQPNGWLVEDPRWPTNIGFNAMVALTWVRHTDLASDDMRRRLIAALVSSKGIKAPPDNSTQDNSLQGWSWIDGTFSWVEPTSLGLLALKRARRAGIGDPPLAVPALTRPNGCSSIASAARAAGTSATRPSCSRTFGRTCRRRRSACCRWRIAATSRPFGRACPFSRRTGRPSRPRSR